MARRLLPPHSRRAVHGLAQFLSEIIDREIVALNSLNRGEQL